LTQATFSLPEVHARWAYSEIADGVFSHRYDCKPRVDELRAQRAAGRAFAELSGADRYALALLCTLARLNLTVFNAGVEKFRVIDLTRTELSCLLVPPMISPELQKFMPFEDFMASLPPTSPGDARNIAANPARYQPAREPLIIGRYFEHCVLLDGYRRAASFWKSAPAKATLKAFLPV
jgi:hypothetical protein